MKRFIQVISSEMGFQLGTNNTFKSFDMKGRLEMSPSPGFLRMGVTKARLRGRRAEPVPREVLKILVIREVFVSVMCFQGADRGEGKC